MNFVSGQNILKGGYKCMKIKAKNQAQPSEF